jgi:trans-aconitate 3-methyltransferase
MVSQTSQKQIDSTFRNYSSEQAAKYANVRLGYSPTLIDYILRHHSTSGGQTKLLLDVGCGPGNATRSLSPHFSGVIGADPGEAMLQVATELAGTTSTGVPIEWQTSAAEDIDKIPGLQPGSVDMITAATAVC